MSDEPRWDDSDRGMGEASPRHVLSAVSGGRATLIINVLAFCMAFIANVETMLIMQKVVGHYGQSDMWLMFFPVAVMFIIRKKVFSLTFLVIFVLLLSELTYQIWVLQDGLYQSFSQKSLGAPQAVVFNLSLICLFLYTIGIAAIKVMNAITSNRREGLDGQ